MVQEYLEGDTLREPLGKGALPLKKALGLATEIAEALAAAHAAGIIHRDLKPENIFVTKEGHAKVLDFGLAKLTEVAGAGSPGGATQSPTMMGTVAGQVMGTAGYMAPEQVEGSDKIDHRADLFAFGCVLYEMVSGRRAFTGKNVIQTLDRIVNREPEPITDVNPDLPLHLGWIAKKCLAKEPGGRYQGAGDLVVDLKALAVEVESGTAFSVHDAAAEATDPVRAAAGTRMLPWALAAIGFVTAAVAILVSWPSADPDPLRPMVRSSIVLPTEAPLAPPGSFHLGISRVSLALSRDGRHLAYVALVDEGRRELWLHDMQTGETRSLPGTQDAQGPFFSPDGERLGFFAEGALKTVGVERGEPQPLTDVITGWGASWGTDGNIYFVPTEGQGVDRVSSGGGPVDEITTPAGDVFQHAWPTLLPGATRLFFSAHSFDRSSILTASVDTPEQPTMLVESGIMPLYAPTGHLVYGMDGNLLAAPLASGNEEVTGDPVVIFDDVLSELFFGTMQATFSETGTLVYAPGVDLSISEFIWVDREGRRSPLGLPPARYGQFALSPDGSSLAYQLMGRGQSQIALVDVDRGVPRLLTSGHLDSRPIWTPDGDALLFRRTTPEGGSPVHRLDVGDATQTTPEVVPAVENAGPWVALDDGLIYQAGQDLYFAPYADDGSAVRVSERVPVRDSPAQEIFAALSPNGRWLAYSSDVNGLWEIYVVSYPETTTVRRVSPAGGEAPRWSPDGSEIIYRFGMEWYAVSFMDEPQLRLGTPTLVLKGPYINVWGYSWELSSDGEQFLVLENPYLDRPITELVVITNFFDELKRRVPVGP